jgi:hypothetical protein
MNSQEITTLRHKYLPLLTLTAVFACGSSFAQVSVDENGNPLSAIEESGNSLDTGASALAGNTIMTATELEELVGPVALYPDDLLAIVLPASTYPLEIVQAARFLERLETDSSLVPDDEWDESIVALLNYPEVLRMMDEEIDWTWRLGEAVIGQQSEVIAAVESFRDRAYAAGNLKTDEYQTVSVDEGVIEIEPVDEEIIYVPYYEPEEVVVYQPRRVYYYYPEPYPVYYYPYPAGYRFRSGLFWGVTTAFHIGWSNHYLHVYHPTYWGHPYYGHYYNDHYYRRPSINVYNTWYVNNSYIDSRYRHRDGDYWRPRNRAGSRPDEPRVNNYYYPPNSGSTNQNGRSNRSVSNRDRLQVRDDGRMNLDLRERQGTPVRADNRQTTGQTIGSNRVASSGRTGARSADRSTGNTDRTNNRAGFAANSGNTTRSSNRQTGSQPDIRFRPRDNDAVSANNRGNTRTNTRAGTSTAPSRSDQPGVSRSAQPSSNRVTASRPSATARSGTSNRSGSAGVTGRSPSSPSVTRTPTTRQSAPAPRASSPTVRRSTPTVRQSAPTVRQSAPATRQSAPRQSAPRQSAPAPRQSAPRQSAPRQSAPAPRQSAPAPRSSGSSAPRAPSSQSSGRSSSRSAPSQSRRSSSPRVRSQN